MQYCRSNLTQYGTNGVNYLKITTEIATQLYVHRQSCSHGCLSDHVQVLKILVKTGTKKPHTFRMFQKV